LLILIFRLSKILRRVVLAFLICFFIFLQQVYQPHILTLFSFIQYFLMGFLLLDVYLSGWQPKIPPIFSFIMGVLSLVFIDYINLYASPYYEYLFVAVLFLFCVLALMDEFWKKIFSLGFLTTIGGMCYSIYLWHDLVMSAVGNKTVMYNFSHSYIATVLWQYCLIIPSVLIFSSCFYLLVEKPCMDRDWPIKLWRFITLQKPPLPSKAN
jgi:peptidoglycan/LPS O-acetylase OafA/YrhL